MCLWGSMQESYQGGVNTHVLVGLVGLADKMDWQMEWYQAMCNAGAGSRLAMHGLSKGHVIASLRIALQESLAVLLFLLLNCNRGCCAVPAA